MATILERSLNLAKLVLSIRPGSREHRTSGTDCGRHDSKTGILPAGIAVEARTVTSDASSQVVEL